QDFSDPYFQEIEEEEEADADDEENSEEDEEDEEDEEEPLTPWFDPAPGWIDTADDTDFLRLQSSYAAAVSFVDAAVDSLLSELAELGAADDCLVVLTSDHGQALGEHGIIGPYRPWLHDELVHIPLLLRLPARLASSAESRNLRIPALTQTP